jgi:hypothetical protein
MRARAQREEQSHARKVSRKQGTADAEYTTKSARQTAKELDCPRNAPYEALHASGIPISAPV